MSQEDNVVYLKNSSAAARSVVEHEVYMRIRQRTVSQLASALALMLDSVDDALFERADKAGSSQAQEEFFMAMRQLRLGRRDLEDSFRATLENGFKRLQAGSGSSPAPISSSDPDLALLDNEALEEAIAVDGMVAKMRAREALRLAHLQAGLAKLFPRQTVDERNSPLDPGQIVGAFASSAAQLNIALNPRLILYKLFDKHVLGALSGLYEEIDRLLVQAGLRSTASRARPASSQNQAATRSDKQQLRQYHSVHPWGTAPLLESLRQLLAEEAVIGLDAAPPSDGNASPVAGPAASLSDLVGALSLMQREVGASVAAEPRLKQTLDQLLADGQAERKQIGALESAAIDIVELLFEAILDDPQLPPLIKALLARLQIPVLKVAFLDGAFFGNRQHPARRLINEMARAALGWVEPTHLERDPLYRRIENIVERILSEFGDDGQLFDELLDEFLAFQEQERERARLVEERARQAAEGKAKVESAKARVDAELQQRVSGRRLPRVVHQLLDDAWSKVLFLSCLKADEDSSEWQRQLAVVDRLIVSVEPKATAEARRQLLTEIPVLLHELREGLNAILFNPFEMTKLFKLLEAEHVRCLTTTATGEALEGAPPVVAEASSGESSTPAASDDLQEYLQQLEAIAIGSWFEFGQGRGGRVRGKLSARLGDGRRLIFVNRSGFKVMDCTPEELAVELRDGKAMMLDDGQLFDKALEAVITSLRRAQASG